MTRLPNLADGLGQAKAQRRISNAAPFLPGIAWTVAAAHQPEAGEVERRNLVDRLASVQSGDPRISVVQKVQQAQLVVRLDSQIQPHMVDLMAIAVVRQRGLVAGKAIESLIEQATSDWQLRFVFSVGVKKLKMSLLAAHFE